MQVRKLIQALLEMEMDAEVSVEVQLPTAVASDTLEGAESETTGIQAETELRVVREVDMDDQAVILKI